jgi:cytochrome b561
MSSVAIDRTRARELHSLHPQPDPRVSQGARSIVTTLTSVAPPTAAAGYGRVAKTLHWLIAALIVLQFGLAWTMPDLPRGQPASGLVSLHLSVGTAILILMLARLAWRLGHGVPPSIVAGLWERRLAAIVHGLLYGLLIVMPVAGWAWASAKGWTVSLFGIVELPGLVPAGWPYRRLAASVHENVAWAILALVGLHVLAALRHRVILRDGVLRRMLP